MSPRTGRPKIENPMNERLYIRCSKEEKERIMDFAKENGFSLLEIIRMGMEKFRSKKQ